MEHRWNDTDSRNPKYSEKYFSLSHSSTTNLTLTGLGLIPGLCIERSATNRHNHGAANVHLVARLIKNETIPLFLCKPSWRSAELSTGTTGRLAQQLRSFFPNREDKKKRKEIIAFIPNLETCL
jgi:hypothetical protein